MLQNVTAIDNGAQGVTLTSTQLGATDNTSSFTFPPCQGAYLQVQGTLSAGTLALQASFDGGTTWVALASTLSVSAPTTNPVPFTAPGGAICRVATAGVTGSPVWYIGYQKAFI